MEVLKEVEVQALKVKTRKVEAEEINAKLIKVV